MGEMLLRRVFSRSEAVWLVSRLQCLGGKLLVLSSEGESDS